MMDEAVPNAALRMGQPVPPGAQYVVIEASDYEKWHDVFKSKNAEIKALLNEISNYEEDRKQYQGWLHERNSVLAERDTLIRQLALIGKTQLALICKTSAPVARPPAPSIGPTIELKPEPTPTWRQWLPIALAPRDGSPVWVRWKPYGLETGSWQHGWAYWNGRHWAASTSQIHLVYVVDWLKSPVW